MHGTQPGDILLDVQIEKPRLAVPVSLIVDDPAPCINPLYYFRLQVNREQYAHHEPCIPLSFLQQFIAVCQARRIRGKFSVLPYPAGLGSILEGWEGCDRHELDRWLDLVRTYVAPRFNITPEKLTHTLALDVGTGRLLDQPEHDRLAGRTCAELTQYFGAAIEILRRAGFAPSGITQPCYFNGSRADYALATLDAIRQAGGPPVTFYFIDGYFEEPPIPPPEVVLLDRERGEAVVSIVDYCHDYFWPTQRPESRRAAEVADQFITLDGRAGRLAELAASDAWLVFVCHWQSLYSDGSRQGLVALDEVAARLSRVHGQRLTWMTNGEIARYRAANEGCDVTVRALHDGWEIELQAALDCPDFTLSLEAPGLGESRVYQVVRQAGDGTTRDLARDPADGTLLAVDAWRQVANRIALCFHLRRGHQTILVRALS